MHKNSNATLRLFLNYRSNRFFSISPRDGDDKCSFYWLKRLNPLKFINNNLEKSQIVDIDPAIISSSRNFINKAIDNYSNLAIKLKYKILEIENGIYKSLQRTKPFETIYRGYKFTAKPLPNGHVQYYREKISFKQLLFDTEFIANKYSKFNYCVVKNIKYSPLMDTIFTICDVAGNDCNTLFIKSLKHFDFKIITNVDNAEFLDTLNKCHIFYTRRRGDYMELRCAVYYRNAILNDRLIYSENNPQQSLSIYKSRDSKMLFLTTNTPYTSELLRTIKLGYLNPKLLRSSLKGAYDKLFLEHRNNHLIALVKQNGKYKLMKISDNRKYNSIVAKCEMLDDDINILGLEAFKNGIILHGINNPSTPVIGLIENANEFPKWTSLIDCGVITPDANPDYTSDLFYFTLENPAISHVPSFMYLTNSKIHLLDHTANYLFKKYTFKSFDAMAVHISTIQLKESDEGIIYFYGFSNQLLKLHSEYEHEPLLKHGFKLCYIHSRSHDPTVALRDIICGIKYLLNARIIRGNILRLVTESSGASLVDELLKEFIDYNMLFILKSPHLPVTNGSCSSINCGNDTNKRIFLVNVGGLDERTPWWESFSYIINKSFNSESGIITFLDFQENGGHNSGNTFVRQISNAAHTAAILVNS